MNFGEGKNLSFSRAGQRGRRRGAARPPCPARRQPPPEARSSCVRDDPDARRRVRRWHRPVPRPSRRPPPPRRSAGGRARRPALRRSAAVARPAARGARSRGRRPRVLVRRAVGRPHAARHAATRARRAPPRAPSTRDTPGSLGPSRRADPDGPLAVQVLRTYPGPSAALSVRARRRAQHRPRLPEGVRDARDASSTSRTSTSGRSTRPACCARRSRTNPDLLIAVVIPRYPDPDGAIAGEASRIGRERVLDALHEVGHDRVAVYDLENDEGNPIYVHSKVCIIDDVWMAVGSDNLNRRSWTHDSEISCAVIDCRRDERAPRDPGGLGDGAAGPGARHADPPRRRAPRPRARRRRRPGRSRHRGSTRSAPGADALDAWHRFRVGSAPAGSPPRAPVRTGAGSEPVRGRGLVASPAARSRRSPARRTTLTPDCGEF